MPVCAARACLLEALQIRRRIRRSAATAVERDHAREILAVHLTASAPDMADFDLIGRPPESATVAHLRAGPHQTLVEDQCSLLSVFAPTLDLFGEGTEMRCVLHAPSRRCERLISRTTACERPCARL